MASLLTGLFLLAGAGSVSALAPGTASASLGESFINICKNGNVTGTFQFSLNSGTPISIAAGSCDDLPVEDGYNSVTELPDSTGATQLSAITVSPSVDTVSLSVPNRTVKVNIPAGQTATTTFTDVPTARIEVCKVAGTSSLLGQTFDFTYTVNDVTSPPFGVAAGSSPQGNCSSPQSYPPNTAVTVAEDVPSDATLSSITSSGTGSCTTNVATATADCTLGATGLTIVTYTDVQPQIEVCKVAGTSSLLNQPFNFTYTYNSISTPSFVVNAGEPPQGNCSTPVAYPPNANVTVTEQIPQGDTVTSITSSGTGSCTTNNPATGAATCTLGTTGTTVVTYTDSNEPQIEVCKIAGDPSLLNQPFSFSYNGGTPFTVQAGNPPGNCSTPEVFAPNAAVTVSETIPSGDMVTSITSSGTGSCTTNVATGTADCTLGATGLTKVTYTDTSVPSGYLEVCKIAGDPSVNGHSFTFSVNGGPGFAVMAGNCSSPIPVPIGTATVSEIQSNPNFYLKNVSTVSVTDPTGSRLLSGPTADPATVSVPGGGIPNETVVTFTNDTVQSVLKICGAQTSPGANLAGVLMPYTYSYTVNGTTTTGTVSLVTPLIGATCSLPIGPFNVVNNDGSPVKITVTAGMPPVSAVDLAQFNYQGNGTVTSEPKFPAPFPVSVTVAAGTGVNVLTFTDGAAH